MIRQFDVFANAQAEDEHDPPLLINLQSDYLDRTATYVVAPLWPRSTAVLPGRLDLPVSLDSRRYVISIGEITSVRQSMLGEALANLDHMHDDIIAALDLLFTGF